MTYEQLEKMVTHAKVPYGKFKGEFWYSVSEGYKMTLLELQPQSDLSKSLRWWLTDLIEMRKCEPDLPELKKLAPVSELINKWGKYL